MAQFTRGFLREVLNADDAEDKIIDRYLEVTSGFKDTIAKQKDELESLRSVKKELDDLKENKGIDEAEYREKYEAEHKAFEEFKAEVDRKETQKAKEQAYGELLEQLPLNKAIIPVALKSAKWDEIELDKDGHIRNVKELGEKIMNELDAFREKNTSRGAETPTPPINNGGNDMTIEKIDAIKDTSARQRAIAENIGLYLNRGKK